MRHCFLGQIVGVRTAHPFLARSCFLEPDAAQNLLEPDDIHLRLAARIDLQYHSKDMVDCT